jgi:hypothetical protein
MKSCPTCNKTFTDQNLSFCIDDGTPLVSVADPADETTVVTPPAGKVGGNANDDGPYVPRDWQQDYQPPGSFAPPGQKRKVWPWVVGIVGAFLIGIVGLGIAFALLVPKMVRSAANANNSNVNVGRQQENSNANSNPSLPEVNSNSDKSDDADLTEDGATTEPTDSNQVLADLTDIEHEWTVANINADKSKLAYILADDYVGTSSDGNSQGKADYLKTIERDTAIEKWEFEDLKVALKGDRATLTGKIRIVVNEQEVVYDFVDKFVWRDGRWQAVSSEVARNS